MPIPRDVAVLEKWVCAWADAFKPVQNSRAWKSCEISDLVENIATARTTKIPKTALRNIIEHTVAIGSGLRSKSSRDVPVKEAAIEADLLNQKSIDIYTEDKKLIGKAHILYQQLFLFKSKQNQVKPDLAGWIELYENSNIKKKITCFEVKDDANNCGYALVENCRQIDLLRRNPGQVHALGDPGEKLRAAWGAIIAPATYYLSAKNDLNKAIDLATTLAKRTQLRIGFLEWNNLDKHLVYRGGSWTISAK